jgi:4-deoxy-L-threo-5-hexosulose-uronate ketol-isomerase
MARAMTTLSMFRKDAMEVRQLPDRESYRRMTTEELRRAFLLDRLFLPGLVTMTYTDADRAIVGGAVPTDLPLRLEASKSEMAAATFAERREVGIVNIGAPGSVRAGGETHALAAYDMLYVGRGVSEIELMSAIPTDPAVFYIVSFPAHTAYPTTLVRAADAERAPVGDARAAGRRTICRYIHPGGAKSCQLVMGLTILEPGNVWNTMPAHTHSRRMEVYMYCGLTPDDMVVHLMGTPQETRNIIVRDRQAVISPSWSIHCGAATGAYTFIWAMGGENQEFADMDGVPIRDLR